MNEPDDQQITRYTPLVRAIAHRYPLPDGWERADIEQWGMLGLWNALKRYDPDGLHKGRPFPTVATFAIRHAIYAHLPEEMKRRRAEFEREEPEPDIADQPTMPLPIRPPAWMLGRDTQPLLVVPLELPDPAPSVEEQVVAAVAGAQISATLEAALLLLSARQRTIIERRFGLSGDGACWTLEEIGHLLGRHRSNIYRQQVKGLAILRAHLSESRDGQIILHRFEEKRQRRVKTRAA